MRRSIGYLRFLGLAAVFLLVIQVSGQIGKNRFYVGTRACRGCHEGAEHGHTYSLWRSSAHARAYSALVKPEARQIAEISGLKEHEPTQSPICLGCHSTGVLAEAWELDSDFRREDGVQCEACHGPGSDYMPAEIMADPARAMMAGLMMPGEKECKVCHIEKGSHVAVLGSPRFNYNEAILKIAHPTDSARMEMPPPRRVPADLTTPHYTGARACGDCHRGKHFGYQLSVWLGSKHARAYATLGTPYARETAERLGLQGDPQQMKECVPCHVTGYGEPGNRFGKRFDIEDGVQCESCHGAGSEYSPEAIMLDPRAAHLAGLVTPTKETCMGCHNEQSPTFEGVFDMDAMWEQIAHPTRPSFLQSSGGPEYKTPFNLALTSDGGLIAVTCEDSDSVVFADTVTHEIVREIKVGTHPHGLCFSPDNRRLYVTNRTSNTLSVIDMEAMEVIATVPVGSEPHGVITDLSGKTIYVANTVTYDISVIDSDTLKESHRLSSARGVWKLSLSEDGSRIYATNNLPYFGPFRTTSRSEVTVIDTATRRILRRPILEDTNLLLGCASVPGRDYMLVTLIRTKNLLPMTRVTQGWVITNGLGVLYPDGRSAQVLLDWPNHFFADPTDIVATSRYAFVTGGGIDQVAVVDLETLDRVLASATQNEIENIIPNHPGIATEIAFKRIAVGKSPRGIIASPDERLIYVADGLDDQISIIDAEKLERIAVIDLGGSKEITQTRWGNQLFHSANVTFQRQFSCHTCHPDGHIDGLTYDIEPDGIGVNPVDNRTLRGILDTAPFKWEGTNPSLSRQCGARLAVFFTRIDPFTPEELAALDRYIVTIPRPANRYRSVGDPLTDPQRRGRDVFFRTRDNTGREIPERDRCNFCHSGPYFTNRQKFFVDTLSPLDSHAGVFDVPHLNNIYDSAPYLHDGRAETLEDIWTKFNPNDRHGVTNDMTKDQLNDLIEYLRTL